MQKDLFKTQKVQANLGAAASQAAYGQGIIRIAGMEEMSIVDGPGVRTVIFTQGCPHFCEGCHNPSTHSEKGGTDADVRCIINAIWRNRHYLSGVTLSGGEPFMQASACAVIAKAAKDMELNVWCYTGFNYESLEILAMMSPTRLTDDGGGEDYDWFDIDFDNAVMEALMLMAEKKGI